MSFIPMFSIFVLLFSGYFAKRLKFFSQNQSTIFIDFVLLFALPSLIIDKIYHMNVHENLLNMIVFGFLSNFLAACTILILGKLFKFTKATIVCMVLLSFFGNTVFVGLPVIQGFLGDNATNTLIFYDQFVTSIPISILGPFILSFAANQNVSLAKNALKILKFPPFIALLLGFVLKYFQIPEFVFAPLRMFSQSVTPVALFAMGLGLSFNSLKSSWKAPLLVIFGKMIIAPLFFALIIIIFNIDLTYQSRMVGILQSAMPPMVLAAAMILKANLDSNLAISSVVLGILFSFISLPMLYKILNYFAF